MEPDSPSEQELLAQIRAGDADALESLLALNYKLVFGVAFRFSGSAADAEDITQEALIRAARAVGRFEGKSKFSTWLYRITCNAAFDWSKRRGRESKIKEAAKEEVLINQSVSTPEDLSKAIEAALVKLSDKEREAIILTVFEGLTHAEVAEISGCAETTVSWRIFTAKRKLKRYLKS